MNCREKKSEKWEIRWEATAGIQVRGHGGWYIACISGSGKMSK